jgi:hypothetical protein
MTAERLRLAGWLSITNAVLTIPSVALELARHTSAAAYEVKIGSLLLGIAGLLLSIYILVALKELLNTRFGFHDTDTLISIFIWATIALTAITIFGVVFPELEEATRFVVVTVVVPLGVVMIVFGRKLTRLPNTLHGLLKPFAYAQIASGFCFATVMLAPLGVLASAVGDVILGMIFLRVAGDSAQ